MASFEIAHEKLEKKEGVGRSGYSNRARDRGGETVNGISRLNWPDASVWAIVDDLKRKPGFPGSLAGSPALRAATLAFFRESFWDALGLDHVDLQIVADEIYEQAVNAGHGRAGRNLQRALNLLNVREDLSGKVSRLYPDLVIDGHPGPATAAALAACVSAGRGLHVFAYLNVLQGAHFVEIIEKDPSQKVNAAGWISRVETRF